MTKHFILIYIYTPIYIQKQIKLRGSFDSDLSNKNSMKYNFSFLFLSNNIMRVFNYKTNNWNFSNTLYNILIRIKLLIMHKYIIVLTRMVEFYYIG